MHKHLVPKAMAALAVAGFVATPAWARPIHPPARLDPVITHSAPAARPASATSPHASKQPFDWADAGLGAAGGVALTVIAAASVGAIPSERRRRQRPDTQPGLT